MAMAGPVPGMPPGMGPVMVLSKCSNVLKMKVTLYFKLVFPHTVIPCDSFFFFKTPKPNDRLAVKHSLVTFELQRQWQTLFVQPWAHKVC